MFQVYKDQTSEYEKRESIERELELSNKARFGLEQRIKELSLQIISMEEEFDMTQDKIQEQSNKWRKEREKLVKENINFCEAMKQKFEYEKKRSLEMEELSEALMENIRVASEREVALSREHEQLLMKVKSYKKVLTGISQP